ncbi:MULTISPECIES: hypothetical protein [unclassified Novosphingobium]|uniref:hypothetical protein n=1 Tax=unclassified Novosphingobium TaxID=2644732 RepID=UPI000D321273|nr:MULTISPECIES: hypothetical protein [unclassified Novosphingobium]PTR08652.1 hypothetical protein C8K11_11198 [Novosphingobium sp. GV055]PUB01375.1 hypothetical protein C8K12_11198 [Novosphingobium sp. GV061]PUB16949.1 hypothetical protein C8K14_11198 [Novosphingobium sp. GV079]PUB39972.1 hypothetical protein C8K10_11198 [Novosphingobium sp. GV027]
MSSQLERVARALHESDHPEATWEDRSDDWKSHYHRRARAAIAAMREPPPPIPELFDHDEAVEWITANCMAIRRDNGDMDYSLGAMIKAYEAGKAAAMQGQPVAWMYTHGRTDHALPFLTIRRDEIFAALEEARETPLYAALRASERKLAAVKASDDAPRPDDDDLLPHLPETIQGERRCGIQRSEWLDGWFVPWSPRNDNQNAEGPWSHWVALAHKIIETDNKATAKLQLQTGANTGIDH